MEGFLGLLVFGSAVGIIIYYVNKKRQEKAQQKENEKRALEEAKRKELEFLKEKWEQKKKEFLNNGLPILNTETLQLEKNEFCHFLGDAFFCKIKQQTVGYEGGSRGVSFRVMKGISFRVGNHRGHYIREEVTDRTKGLIYLTSKKIIFSSIKNSSVIKHKDIINLDVADNMLQIQTDKKTYLFQIVDSFDFMVILEFIMNEMKEEAPKAI